MADFITLLVSNTRPGHPLDPYHIVQVIPLSGNIKEHILTDGTPRPLGVNATARLVTPTVINEQTIREFIIYYVRISLFCISVFPSFSFVEIWHLHFLLHFCQPVLILMTDITFSCG